MKKYLVLVLLFIAIPFVYSDTYLPFRYYNLTDGAQLYITLEGSRSSYVTNPIYVNIDGDLNRVMNSSCNYIGGYYVCYTDSNLDLENDIGDYDKVFGKIPEISLTLVKKKTEVTLTPNLNATTAMVLDKIRLNVSLANTGSTKIKKGYFYVKAENIKKLDNYGKYKYIEKLPNLWEYAFYDLGINESENPIFDFQITKDNDVTLTYYARNEDFTTEKEDITVDVKPGLNITLFGTKNASYDQEANITMELIPLKNIKVNYIEVSAGDLIENTTRNSRYAIDSFSLENTTNLSFTIRTVKSGNNTIRISGEYQDKTPISFSYEWPIHVVLKEPSVDIAITKDNVMTTVVKSRERYDIIALTNATTSSYRYIVCTFNNNYLGNKTILPGEKYSIMPVPVMFNTTTNLTVNCTLKTKYGQKIYFSDSKNITIMPNEYRKINTSIIKDIITSTTQTTQTTTTQTQGNIQERSFLDKIIDFFKALF